MYVGVVFDSGDSVSHSVPVYDGYCFPHAVQRFNLAGADVTLHLKQVRAPVHPHHCLATVTVSFTFLKLSAVCVCVLAVDGARCVHADISRDGDCARD